MKITPVSELTIGQVLTSDCVSTEGELLIAGGTVLTARHFEVLRRRKLTEVCLRDHRSDDEIRELLDKELLKLSGLDLDDNTSFDVPAVQLELPQLRSVARGQTGLEHLLASEPVSRVDRIVEAQLDKDRPEGDGLAQTLKQLSAGQRSESYKTQQQRSYRSALVELSTMLSALAQTSGIPVNSLKNTTEGFLKTMLSDRTITLCLACTNHSGQEYLFHHSLNVALLSMNIALSSGYSHRQIVEIGLAGLLHDIGMLMVPLEIRTKDGNLNRDEWFEIKKHPILGLHALERVPGLPESVSIVAYQNHERENGQGYPRQRSGRFIHAYSKIVSCADMFDAMSSPRAHRGARAPYQAMEQLVRLAGDGTCNTQTVRDFLNTTSLFPVGSYVELSDHRIARVIGTNGTSYTKPTVMIMSDQNGRPLPRKRQSEANLKLNPELQIIRSHHQSVVKYGDIMDGL